MGECNFEPDMRSRHDIESMIDYLMARDLNHPDISILRWVLSDNQAGVPEQVRQLQARFDIERKGFEKMLIEHTQESSSLREKLRRATEDMVPKADFDNTVNMRVNYLLSQRDNDATAHLQEANKDLSRMVTEQANEIASLKEKLGRFVTPPTRMGA